MAELRERVDEEYIRYLILERNESHGDISRALRDIFPDVRGLSRRSIRRYCSERGIRKYISNDELLKLVGDQISQVS